MHKLLFQIICTAIGTQKEQIYVSVCDNWKKAISMAATHCVVELCTDAILQLPKENRPSYEVLMKSFVGILAENSLLGELEVGEGVENRKEKK